MNGNEEFHQDMQKHDETQTRINSDGYWKEKYKALSEKLTKDLHEERKTVLKLLAEIENYKIEGRLTKCPKCKAEETFKNEKGKGECAIFQHTFKI